MRKYALLLLTSALPALLSAQVIVGPPELVSINVDGTGPGDDDSNVDLRGPYETASDDGRYVFFQSDSTILTNLPDNNGDDDDLLVRDLLLSTTTLISQNEAGAAAANDGSRELVPTANPRLVVFVSSASDLVPGLVDDNGRQDVFIRDLDTGRTDIVSVDLAGTAVTTRGAKEGKASADGRYVFFLGLSSEELAGVPDGNGPIDDDLFRRDLENGVTELVNFNAAGDASSDRGIDSYSISSDGRTVVFESRAGNLLSPALEPGRNRVYVRDMDSGTTISAAANLDGTPAEAQDPLLSENGRFLTYVGFGQQTDTPVPDPNNTYAYLRDLETGAVIGLDVRSDGTSHADRSGSPKAVTPDGAFVLFTSAATDLIPGVAREGINALYRYDVAQDLIELVSVDQTGARTIEAASSSEGMSADGRFVVFTTLATDVVPGLVDDNGDQDAFVRDMLLGRTYPVSLRADGAATGNDRVSGAYINRSGNLVVFDAEATDLTLLPDTQPDVEDVFAVRIDACIDRTDVADLFWRIRRRTARPGFDDFNNDGRVNVADARALALQCTNSVCAPCE